MVPLLLLALALLFCHADALQCMDSEKGVCVAGDLYGWCYYNMVNGTFHCDTERFCVNQGKLKGKRTAGCFKNTHCCCNVDDMCNYGFIKNYQEKAGENTQSCVDAITTNQMDQAYDNCYDKWCTGFIFKGLGFGSSSKGLYQGCQSRMHWHYQKWKAEDEQHANNSLWWYLDKVVQDYTCSEIIEDTDLQADGVTKKACIDIKFMMKKQPQSGKFCCCHGSDSCNAKIAWSDKSKVMKKGKGSAGLTYARALVGIGLVATLLLKI